MKLIDADALTKTLIPLWNCHDDSEFANKDIWQAIENAPPIEPERKKGKWIEKDDGWGSVYYECSVCGKPYTLIDGLPSDNKYNYCPNCGERMIQEGEK